MAVKKNVQIRLIKRPSGVIKDSDFSISTENIDTANVSLNEGEVFMENLFTGLDPGMRGWMDDMHDSYAPPVELGTIMPATCVSRVIASQNSELVAGDLIWTLASWQNFQTLGPDLIPMAMKLPQEPKIPLSTYLSVLGYTGLTAYSGMLSVAKPKDGDNILVSGAAGGVGSVAGQIARHKANNCRVVGIAGSTEKCNWLKDVAGFDDVINYKNASDMQSAIKEKCPNGVDLFFDNVGGATLDAALMNLNMDARVIMCGTISNYNNDVSDRAGPANMWQLLVKNAKIEGFTVSHPEHVARWQEYRNDLENWILEGKLHYRDQIVDGIENTLNSFRSLFESSNTGRVIVKFTESN